MYPSMTTAPSVVCPVDFSEPSRTALQYASVIAGHFGARLIVVSVDDPLLASAAESAGLPSLAEETERELRRFVTDTLPSAPALAATIDVQVCAGKPAQQILRVALAARADLIVMSSHGRSGLGKRFFGSTTERVLRETTIPVLVTPKHAERAWSLSAISRYVRHVLAPVDLTPASCHQVTIAAGIAAGLEVPLILAHVLEPVYVPPRVRLAMPGSDQERRTDVEAQLLELAESSGTRTIVDAVVLVGDAAEEIVRLADIRGAGLIVMGLHSSGVLGPRMGSVTYRVLCLARSLVLALPPSFDAGAQRKEPI
jgi:nucleotide-binding universal stress UspA family protein